MKMTIIEFIKRIECSTSRQKFLMDFCSKHRTSRFCDVFDVEYLNSHLC